MTANDRTPPRPRDDALRETTGRRLWDPLRFGGLLSPTKDILIFSFIIIIIIILCERAYYFNLLFYKAFYKQPIF